MKQILLSFFKDHHILFSTSQEHFQTSHICAPSTTGIMLGCTQRRKLQDHNIKNKESTANYKNMPTKNIEKSQIVL